MENLNTLFNTIIDKRVEEKILKKVRNDTLLLAYMFSILAIYILFLVVSLIIDLNPEALVIPSIIFMFIIFSPLIISEIFEPFKKLGLNKSFVYLAKTLIEQLEKTNLRDRNFVTRWYKEWYLRFLFIYLKNQFYTLKNNLEDSYVHPVSNDYIQLFNRINKITGKQFIYIVSSNQQESLISLLTSLSHAYFNKLGYVEKENPRSIDSILNESFSSLATIENIEIVDTGRNFDLQKLKNKKALIIYACLICVGSMSLSHFGFINSELLNSLISNGGFLLSVVAFIHAVKKD